MAPGWGNIAHDGILLHFSSDLQSRYKVSLITYHLYILWRYENLALPIAYELEMPARSINYYRPNFNNLLHVTVF